MGLVLISPEQTVIEKSLRLGFPAINNEVEYEALIQGIAMVQKMRGRAMEMISDSKLVVGQVNGELEARDVRMREYLSQVKCLQSGFDLSAYRTSPEVETLMRTHWPRLPHPRRGNCLELFLSSI